MDSCSGDDREPIVIDSPIIAPLANVMNCHLVVDDFTNIMSTDMQEYINIRFHTYYQLSSIMHENSSEK